MGELKDQFGKSHKLEDYKGKVIFLNFWATWCGPCRSEMPEIQKLYEEYTVMGNDSEVVILGVAGPKGNRTGRNRFGYYEIYGGKRIYISGTYG